MILIQNASSYKYETMTECFLNESGARIERPVNTFYHSVCFNISLTCGSEDKNGLLV